MVLLAFADGSGRGTGPGPGVMVVAVAVVGEALDVALAVGVASATTNSMHSLVVKVYATQRVYVRYDAKRAPPTKTGS